MKPSLIDLTNYSEDDVVELFKRGLASFMEHTGGSFSSRRVTLKQEGTYPSDQDYALVFGSPSGFRLHLFGLQFKRLSTWGWDRETGWLISSGQRESMRRMGHVLAYCLPRPCRVTPSNSLHGFYFVHAKCISRDARALRVSHSFNHKHDGHEENWAHMRIVWSTNRPDVWDEVPRLAWGEFLDATEQGAVAINVPGTRDTPPALDDRSGPPVYINRERGIGLTILCTGAWGSEWARHQIGEHLWQWSSEALSPPAAIVAYESFSKTIEFIEVGI